MKTVSLKHALLWHLNDLELQEHLKTRMVNSAF